MRNRTIDIIKGICMIMIIVTHYSWTQQERLNIFILYIVNMAVPTLMICTGYTNALALEKKKLPSVAEAYKCDYILYKILRIFIPYCIVVIYEMICNDKFSQMSGLDKMNFFLYGGDGPGSYYTCIMIQFIFLFPIIFWGIKKHGLLGLLMGGVVNLLFELIHNAYQITAGTYRLIIFRYLLLISFGCFLALYHEKRFKLRYEIVGIVMSIGFIALVFGGGYEPRLLNDWTGTSFLACLYLLPVFTRVIKRKELKFIPLEIIGRASFNIFLVQKVYFCLYTKDIYPLFMSKVMRNLVNLLICISIGIVFYYLETMLTKRIINVVKKKLSGISVKEIESKIEKICCK